MVAEAPSYDQVHEAHGPGADKEHGGGRADVKGIQGIEDAGAGFEQRREIERDGGVELEDVAQPDDGLRHEDVLGQAAVFVVAEGDALGATVALADATETTDPTGDDRAKGNVIANL